MKRDLHKICALLLALVLAGSATVTPALAQGPAEPTPPKDEIVYVNLGPDGGQQSMYVVNAYDLSAPATVVDYGDYAEVRNLTTTQVLDQRDGAVSFEAPAGRFYYQGKLEGKQAPWTIDISYTLDGEPIKGEELGGRSGHLKLALSLRETPGADPVYIDNYALQGTVTLDSETCKNIVAPDATMANVGGSKQLSYIVLPGKMKDFTIEADVTDFEMPGIQWNGICLALNLDDPDTTELKDQVYDLQDGAVQLDDGSGQLRDGVIQLRNGAVDLKDGTEDLYDGVKDLKKGVSDLDDGSMELHAGMTQLKGGFEELGQGSAELKAGLALTQQTIIQQLRDAGISVTLPAPPADPLDTAYLIQVNQMLDRTLDAAIQELSGQISAIEGRLRKLDADPQPVANSQATGPATDADPSAGEREPADSADSPLDGEQKEQEAAPDGADPAEDGEGTPQEGQPDDGASPEGDTGSGGEDTAPQENDRQDSGAAGSVDAVAAAPLRLPIRRLAALLRDGDRITDEEILAAQLAQLEQALAALTQAKQLCALTGGTLEYIAGTETLAAGYAQVYTGWLDLHGGISKLYDGAKDLFDGVRELNNGAGDLKSGVDSLYQGATQLRDGTFELHDQTRDLDQEVDDRIDEVMDEYRTKNFTPVSFVSSRNTQVHAVQFVMKTSDIELPEEEAPLEEEAAPMTFWDRLKALLPHRREE